MLQVDGFGDSSSEDSEEETNHMDDSWGKKNLKKELSAENSKDLSAILGKVEDTLLKILNHAEDVYYHKKCRGKLYSEEVLMDLQKTTGTCRADLDFHPLWVPTEV